MKKYIIIPLIIIGVIIGYISVSLFINNEKSVDGNKKSTGGKTNIEYIKSEDFKNKTYDKDIIENYRFDNIYYDNLDVNIPKPDSFNKITITGNYPYKNIEDPMKLLEEQRKFINYYMGEDIDERYLLDSANGMGYEDMIEAIKNGTYLKNGQNNYPALTYCLQEDNRYEYALAFGGFEIIGFNKGFLYNLTGGTSTDPEESCEQVRKYGLSDETDDEYDLYNGKLSIRDGIEFVEKYFNENLPYENNKKVKMKVQYVTVLKVRDGLYAYQFNLARNYNGISFESGGTVWDTTSDYEYDKDRAIAYMINIDDIDCYCGTHNGNTDTIENNEEIKNVVTPESVMKIISEEVGENSTYTVSSVSLIYRLKIINDVLAEGTKYKGTPCYKVTGINSNDNKEVYFYVDAETGKIDYASKKFAKK